MADEEAEQESGPGPDVTAAEIALLEERLQELEDRLGEGEEAVQATTDYCQRFCQTLLEYAEKWKAPEDSLALLEVYTVAIQSYAKARPYLTSECENVALVLERLALSCIELLLCFPHEFPDDRWETFQSTIKAAHQMLTENGSPELFLLYNVSQEAGVWKDPVLHKILNHEAPAQHQIDEYLLLEGPVLLEMRIKRLLKLDKVAAATSLAKTCSDHHDICKKGNFKQIYLTCLCAASPNIKLIEEITKVDCKDALDMICNLESDGDEKTALILCAAFLSRQLQYGEMDCAWELTLFWSKLQRRVDPSIQVYLKRCHQLSLLTKTVYHIFFLIKVIQSETESTGLPTCIELCVRALRLESSENNNVKISICKTISCLLPDDLEVKRACQLSEFLLEPTVDAYYAVEMLYNQPDQKYDEESLPVPNSLRCELLLVLKTRWPFDPEFWDWKTLKRQCLALMGEEASIVSSIDELNDNEVYDQVHDYQEPTNGTFLNGLDCFDDGTNILRDIQGKRQKKRENKRKRENGFVSERFRNWEAYMQYCVLCDKEFLGHRIVRHAQKHYTDGVYSCPICAKQYSSKESFVPHVTLHVKKSCKERLATMKPLKRLGRPPKKALPCARKKSVVVSKQERPIKKNSLYSDDFIVFNDDYNSDDEEKDNEHDITPVQNQISANEFPCPVLFCGKKGFKYFKNLIAHVKGHKDSEEAKRFLEMQSQKVICQYCRRHFVSVTHLNDHLQMHCGSQPYICIQMKCKASFNSYTELLTHRKEHPVFRAKCMFPKCGRIFSQAYLLYGHEAQHYNTYTCRYDHCGKIYHSQLQLEKHLSEHSRAEASVPESQSGTTAKLAQSPITDAYNEHVTIKEEAIPMECSVNSNFTAETQHSGDIMEHAVAQDSHLSQAVLTQNVASLTSDGLEQTMHLLDHILPPPTEALPATNLSPILPSSTIMLSQVLPHTADILDPAKSSTDSSNVNIPSLAEEFHDILMNRSKLNLAGNSNYASDILRPTNPVVGEICKEPSLPVFQDRKNYPNISSKDQDSSLNSGGINIEVLTSNSITGQVNSTIPFNVHTQTAELSENNLVMSGFQESMKSENVLSLSLETSSILSNVLKPVVHNKTVTPSVPPLPAQKYKCNVDGCTRIYNSVQSIGKHMKTTHPEHYDAFKLDRKNRKRQRSGRPGILPTDGKLVYYLLPGGDGSTNPVFPSQVQNGANPSSSIPLLHIPNPVFPTHLDNLVNPILTSMESIISQGLSKNVAETLLGSEVENLANAALTSQLEDLAKVVLPLKFESGSDPFLPMPTENDPMPVLSSLTGSTLFSPLGSNTNHDHVLTVGEAANSVFVKEENDAEAVFSKQVGNLDTDTRFSLDKSTGMLSNSGETKANRGRNPKNRERKPKHRTRAKCPAIIRDGKFICSRCFRVFTNPRSLGGHLSKRTICKPHNEFEMSQEVQQGDGKASVLASMILSSSPIQNLQPLQQTSFNPEITFKDQPFLQTIASDNLTAAFLPGGFTQSNVSNFSTCGNEEGRDIKQELATRILENRAASLIGSSDRCIPGKSQIQDGGSNILNSNVNNCSHTAAFSEENLLNTVENGLCAKVLNSVEENRCISNPVSSTRVSVINGPQNCGLTVTKKRGGSSKKKKKSVDVPAVIDASHNVTRNILLAAAGNLPASIGGNLQMTTDLQPNFLTTCGSELLENLAKHLNSTDKQLFMSCINESLKASSEVHALSHLAIKQEESDSLILPPYTRDSNGQSELEIQPDFTGKHFHNIPSDAAEVFPVNSNIQSVYSGLPQRQNTDLLPADMQNVISTSSAQSPGSAANITGCPISSTPEPAKKSDAQILEIVKLVQKLQLGNDLMSENLENDPATECPSIDTFTQSLSVIVPNPSLNVVEEQSPDSKPLIDKSHKPFVCHENECTYCAMTKDALLKHYAKVHRYTYEKIQEIKKRQLKFAPFRCVVPLCMKTFTRNSNLRAHCQSMHHFTSEQMVKLRIKRPYGRKSANENITSIYEMPRKNAKVRKRAATPLVPRIIIKKEFDLHQDKLTLLVTEPDKVLENGTPVMNSQNPELVPSLNQKSKTGSKVKRKKKEQEPKHNKAIEKDVKPNQGHSAYKPYKCVHQGCTAAFTIQQNLILHYQAVHKSDVSKFTLEEEIKDEHDECKHSQICKEFRCMETDCSRIFQEVASLIQHYMKLHEMIAEEIENVISFVHVGQFKCDQSHCATFFTTCSSYIEHLEEAHDIKMKQIKLDDDDIYKCDCEGCDRVYATRSNLLRHIFRKHNDKHKEHLLRPRKLSLSDQDNHDEKPGVPKQQLENEGIDIPKTKQNRGDESEKDLNVGQGQRRRSPLSLKYGRHTYSLKAKDDALAECIENHAKQFPCMIRGCSSIVTSEHSTIRHYKCHKLSKAFILKHRRALIVCKRRKCTSVKTVSSKLEPIEDKISEVKEPTVPPVKEPDPCLAVSSDESTVSTSQQSENEKDEMDELAELFIAKLSNEDSTGSHSHARTSSFVSSDFQETSSCQSEPQRDANSLKRLNKQKHVTPNKMRKVDTPDEILSAETSSTLSCEDTVTAEQNTEEPPAFDLGSFKPMGFEVSFLKFLEESAAKQKKSPTKDYLNTETNMGSHPSGIKSNEKISDDDEYAWECSDTDTYILFANPFHLPDIDNVHIVLEDTFNDCIELVIKQLNELKPTVVLERLDICWDESNIVAKEQSFDIDGEASV
ncbi:hypothetical protein FKM82_011038 [Ascaphus truei]